MQEKKRFLNPLLPKKNYYGDKKDEYFFRYSYIPDKLPSVQKSIVSWSFWIGFIIIPFAFAIVFTILRVDRGETLTQFTENYPSFLLLSILFQVIIPLIAFAIIMTIDGARILFNGGIAFFLFYFLFNGFNYIIVVFLGLIRSGGGADISVVTLNIAGAYIQIVLEVLIAVGVFLTSKQLQYDFKRFFKSKKWWILLWAFVLFVASFIFSYIFSQISVSIENSIGQAGSANQNSINSLFGTRENPNIPGIISVILLSVFVAPFVEELATRHGIFSITSNKWRIFAVLASTIFFAGMHVTGGLDFYNIFSFLGVSIVLSVGFILLRRVFVYTWFAHMFFNTFTLFVILLTFFGDINLPF